MRVRILLGALLILAGSVMSGPRAAAAVEREIFIVPDLETYLYYISLWDADNQFPIFFDTGKYMQKLRMSYPNATLRQVEATVVRDPESLGDVDDLDLDDEVDIDLSGVALSAGLIWSW